MTIGLIGTILSGCANQSPTPQPSEALAEELVLVTDMDWLKVWATEDDRQTALDVADAIDGNAERICIELQTPCEFSVIVEIYPDQERFDQYVMNPEMQGFFAISGTPNRIQMVSPANSAPHKISYQDGVLVAVHEFVHLALDEINPALPTWLDEGTAVYVGPHELYTMACRYVFPFEMIPSFGQLENAYHSVQAPDLYAFTVADFIVHEYGMEKLNRLLRTPADMKRVLGVSSAGFEEQWHDFMVRNYHNYKSAAAPALGGVCVSLFVLAGLVILSVVRRQRKTH
jgi:RNA polymerase sigma-70 factor (ECF subfamily)